MIQDPTWQWLLSALFAATAAASLARLNGRGMRVVVDGALHVTMSLAMIAMCWPWWNLWPKSPQMALFLAGAFWCTACLVKDLRRDATRLSLLWHDLAHLFMMTAMMWMIAGMPASDGVHHTSVTGGTLVIGLILTVILAVAAVVSFADYVLPPSAGTGATTELTGTAMHTGMAVMCWLMLAH